MWPVPQIIRRQKGVNRARPCIARAPSCTTRTDSSALRLVCVDTKPPEGGHLLPDHAIIIRSHSDDDKV